MADPEFFLALKVTGGDRAGGLLQDVVASALGRIGYSGDAAASILREFDAEVRKRSADVNDWDVQFRVDAGKLVIVLAVPGAQESRVTRPLPGPD